MTNGKNDDGTGDKSAKDVNHDIGGSEMRTNASIERFELGVMESGSSGESYARLMSSPTGSLVKWTAYANVVEELAAVQAALTATEFKYRRQMWMSHGHGSIYGDDGEMQCVECRDYGTMDYKRDPLDKVENAFHRACVARMEKAMQRAKET